MLKNFIIILLSVFTCSSNFANHDYLSINSVINNGENANLHPSTYPLSVKTTTRFEADIFEIESLQVFISSGQNITADLTLTYENKTVVFIDLTNFKSGTYLIKTANSSTKIHKE